MKKILLTGLCAVIFSGMGIAQEINEAIELYNNGVKAYQEKNYETAIQNVEQALTIASSIESEEAITLKENCETIIPTLYFAFGRDFASDKKTDEAIKNLNKAIETAQKYGNDDVKESVLKLIPQVYMSAGAADFNDKKYAEAITNYKKVLEYAPDNSTAKLRIGLAYLQAKDETNAITELVAAKELAEQTGKTNDAATASKQLGRIYYVRAVDAQKDKKWNVVITNAKSSIEYDNSNTQVQKLLGIAAVETKDWNTAVTALEAVMSTDPNAKDKNNTLYRLALAYEATNNKNKACETYKELMTDANYKAMAEHKIKNELKCN